MLPDWFDAEPWSVLLEGGALGLPYSYFFKYRPGIDSYDFFITDLCTIWHEVADKAQILATLKPFESFLELAPADLLKVLSEMLEKEGGPKVTLQPAAEEGLKVEGSSQIGFVKFAWTFDCKIVDRKAAALHFRSKLLIPAIHAASDGQLEGKSISRTEWASFTARCKTSKATPVYPPAEEIALLASLSPEKSIATSNSTQASPTKDFSTAPLSQPPTQLPSQPTHIPSSQVTATQASSKPTTSQSTQKGNAELELERRRQLEEMVRQQQKPADDKNKKKRKLI